MNSALAETAGIADHAEQPVGPFLTYRLARHCIVEYRIILFLRFAVPMGARGIDIPRSLSKRNIALKKLLADTKQ